MKLSFDKPIMELDINFLQIFIFKECFWFRIFGYGFHGKDTLSMPLLFSEREGYTKHFMIKNWSFRFLNKIKI
jgi:hypothetical protein